MNEERMKRRSGCTTSINWEQNFAFARDDNVKWSNYSFFLENSEEFIKSSEYFDER